MGANEAIFKQGTPIMSDHTPGADVPGGEVVVVGVTPMVAHRDVDNGELGALAVSGGIYEMTGDAAILAGVSVFWDDTAKKVTETASGNSHFGFTRNAEITGDTVKGWVIHDPKSVQAA
ncbi:unnamed protein product [marine sediment metagenome]|uniref:DUF2190 family protein n=1 Tax=marine sediment metagenome TaxID=412755 RepID=X1U889_9ZZZZ